MRSTELEKYAEIIRKKQKNARNEQVFIAQFVSSFYMVPF